MKPIEIHSKLRCFESVGTLPTPARTPFADLSVPLLKADNLGSSMVNQGSETKSSALSAAREGSRMICQLLRDVSDGLPGTLRERPSRLRTHLHFPSLTSLTWHYKISCPAAAGHDRATRPWQRAPVCQAATAPRLASSCANSQAQGKFQACPKCLNMVLSVWLTSILSAG